MKVKMILMIKARKEERKDLQLCGDERGVVKMIFFPKFYNY